MRAAASAPASSANLGPGYDVLALALGLRCTVIVEETDDWHVESEAGTDDAGLARAAAAATGTGVGPLRVSIGGDVPVGRGLGSSAALIVAAAAAVRAAAGLDVDRDAVFADAVEVEGHPDNVAAAVYGGLVAVGPGGSIHPLEVHDSLTALVAVPDATLSTAEARRATADPVGTGVAARTAARLAFLIEGLRTGDPELLAEAGGDELHEERRAHLSPLTGRLLDAAREAGAQHAAWSGAGPAAIAFVTVDEAEQVAAAWRAVLEAGGGIVLDPGIDRSGLVVGTG